MGVVRFGRLQLDARGLFNRADELGPSGKGSPLPTGPGEPTADRIDPRFDVQMQPCVVGRHVRQGRAAVIDLP